MLGVNWSSIPQQNKICYECMNITTQKLSDICIKYNHNTLLLWFVIGFAVTAIIAIIAFVIHEKKRKI